MPTDHITARRTLVALDPVWLEPVVDALAHAAPLEPAPSMPPGTRRLAEFLTQHNGPDSRYSRLGPIPKRPVLSPSGDDWLTTPLDGEVPHAEFWQFDYGDRVHGHVVVSPDHTGSCFPLLDFRIATRCGTTSRHRLVPPNPSVQAVVEIDSLDGPACRTDTDLLADYIAGNRHDVGALDTITASTLSSAAGFRTQSGPPLNGRVWNRALPAPGTDLAFDVTGAGGLHAVYRVYPKKRTNQ